MSYPTQEQPNEGASQPPFGAPEQQPYGAVPAQPYGADPNQPYGGMPGQPYGAPVTPQTNGLATAGLILGILPTSLVGAVVSILGLSRAAKIGGVGRGRAWAGLILSIIWTVVIALVVVGAASGGSKVVKRLNPGCISAMNFSPTFESKVESDSSNLDALKADLQQAVNELNKDAGKSTNSAAAVAMRTEAKDIQTLLDDVNSGTAPDEALVTKLSTDDTAINTACGR